MKGALYVGDPEYVARKIRHLKQALGIQRFTMHIPVGPMSHEKIMQTIRLLGEEVRKHM
jgi:alkanesulfonate monooxygenase SsuD/methylene tetrahydromethanopterin reductase-like flavin-dependent oxidoreductase (luciferase family)